MEANELRVGNYVSYIGNETRVTVISDGFVSTLKSAPLTYNQVAPMPLTKEWLFKLGFGINEIHARYIEYEHPKNDRITIDYQLETFSMFIGNEYICRIKYVHQLQNLYFALTGEELTLILK